MFSEKDIRQIENRGMTIQEIENQLNYFRKGFSHVKLIRPAIIGDGIIDINDSEKESFIRTFDKHKSRFKPVKFVPASGAATRMFKRLFEARHYLEKNPDQAEAYLQRNPLVRSFFEEIEKYPFYFDLKNKAKEKHLDFDLMKKSGKYHAMLELLLDKEGLDYGELPKALLKFHVYGNISRTAFEEHLIEAGEYLVDDDREVALHFTIPPVYRSRFEDLAGKVSEEKTISIDGEMHFNVSFSEQEPRTDTIAVNLNNEPFRDKNGNLLFRPGGHGSLLGNLNKIGSAMIFISNIDNIPTEETNNLRIRYKKLLGGFLLDRIERIHGILRRLHAGEKGEAFRREVIDLINEISNDEAVLLSKEPDEAFQRLAFDFLNKPVRICGMVENVGEPGGGPFWVKDRTGKFSRQIVERSQVDLSDFEQKNILDLATHFNPVDMVCFIRNYNDQVFNLFDYRDPDQGFISKKSYNGSDIKALEHPGLWNGSMEGWITYFINVPLATFTPVKTVFDLLRLENE